jgi:predicted phage tail protein
MTKLLKKLTFTACAVTLAASSYAEIISTVKVQDVHVKVEEKLKQYKPEDMLVVFDIDNTLTLPANAAVYMVNIKKYMDPFDKLMGDLSLTQRDMALGLAEQMEKGNLRLLETNAPKVIKALQEKKVPVIAFSSTLTGPLGDEKRLEVMRSNRLSAIGLDFGKAFAQQEVTFSEIPAYNNQYPVYYKGLLAANGEFRKETRQSVIVAFLKGMKMTPKVIVMVDSKKKNLEDVETALKIYDPSIWFMGVEYTAAAPLAIAQAEFSGFWKKIVEKVKSMKDNAVDQTQSMTDKAVTKAVDLKDQAVDKAVEIKDKTVEVVNKTVDKAVELKDQAVDKSIELKDKVLNTSSDKAEEMGDKAKDLKNEAADKASELKDKAADKAQDLKYQAADKGAEIKGKAVEMKEKAENKVSQMQENHDAS